MTKLSDHFSRSEFACNCGCGFDTVDVELVAALEQIRSHFKVTVVVCYGCRCHDYNKLVGGTDNSFHMRGRAADIQVIGHPPIEVQEYAESAFPEKYGIGRYTIFTHIDTRTGPPARWRG